MNYSTDNYCILFPATAHLPSMFPHVLTAQQVPPDPWLNTGDTTLLLVAQLNEAGIFEASTLGKNSSQL